MISMTVGALWLGVGLVAARPGGPGADGAADHTAVLRQYEAARDRAGRGADAQVKLCSGARPTG